MMRHLWAICKKEDILRVKWIHSYMIKHHCFWSMKLPTDSSWTLRKIFELRREGQQFIKVHVGNGRNTFLWYDNWHSLGPLYLRFGDRVVSLFGRSLNAKFSFIIHDGEWRWQRGRSDLVRDIIASTPHDLVPCMDRVDRVFWSLKANGCDSTKSAWSGIRSCAPEVDWFHMVWYPKSVPRWFFIQWIAILNRMSTKDRLSAWGVLNDRECRIFGLTLEAYVGLFLMLGIYIQKFNRAFPIVREVLSNLSYSNLASLPLSITFGKRGIIESFSILDMILLLLISIL